MADGFPDEKLMEHFSEAYVRAIASSVGFAVQREEHDFDSIDLVLIARGFVEYGGEKGKRCSPRLGIQLKSTFHHQPDDDGGLTYDLKVKNYNDLRREDHSMPLILVVVSVPQVWEDRLVWSPNELRLLRCAFWTSLRSVEPTANISSTRIQLNTLLSPDELCRLMYLVAQEELL